MRQIYLWGWTDRHWRSWACPELIQTERPQTQGGPKLYLYNKDDQGSTTSILGEDGSAVKVYDYDPYGNTEVLSGDGFDNEVCYTGQIYDERTGLYYYNARFYDASAGAFTSQDTYRGEGSDPRTLNLYGYCGGDPVNLTDPTGHWWLAKAWKGLKSKVKKSKVYRGAKKIKKKAKKVYHKAKKKVQRAKRAVKKTGHKIKKKAKKIIRKAKKKLRRAKDVKKPPGSVSKWKNKIKKKAKAAYVKATKWHFEERIKRNNNIPSYQVVSRSPDWHKLSRRETRFHDNGDNYPEEKYINYDGREVVFDGKNKEKMRDDKYMGTYNYVAPYVLPEKTSRRTGDYIRYCYTRTGHFVVDVAPYLLMFKSNTRSQFEATIGL